MKKSSVQKNCCLPHVAPLQRPIGQWSMKFQLQRHTAAKPPSTDCKLTVSHRWIEYLPTLGSLFHMTPPKPFFPVFFLFDRAAAHILLRIYVHEYFNHKRSRSNSPWSLNQPSQHPGQRQREGSQHSITVNASIRALAKHSCSLKACEQKIQNTRVPVGVAILMQR